MTQMNILIVEEVATNAQQLCAALRELDIGFTIAPATEALAVLEKTPTFNLILIDLHLPTLDGFTIIDELRSSAIYERHPTPIIALIDHDLSDNKVTFLKKVGLTDYIPKPVTKEKLLRAVTQHVVMKKKS